MEVMDKEYLVEVKRDDGWHGVLPIYTAQEDFLSDYIWFTIYSRDDLCRLLEYQGHPIRLKKPHYFPDHLLDEENDDVLLFEEVLEISEWRYIDGRFVASSKKCKEFIR
ncbi:hypothetical protein JOD43_003717 [Pullulanibacillus pueri]|uniref:Uncharacterized protein n=1 Tax=Pullulanibacillus pueri TaxID=1437324 RepID=A0A8J2ZZ39_9BACL|nr:hypothetical protein [Pullulanibacillus pueri]MBM7683537.1 hypothetical protein [Pullulanibacillus pueri]GGH86883.1 hypothetical protein GCM10007096_35620 [Pullulanibacillus pueri]